MKDKLAQGFTLEEIVAAGDHYEINNQEVMENDMQENSASWGMITASFKTVAAAGLIYATII